MGFCKRRIKCTWLQSAVANVLGLVLAVVAFQPSTDLWAHGAGGHGASNTPARPKPSAAMDKLGAPGPIASFADRPMQPRHGGQITATKHHYFEVVYTPSEARLYVYNASQLGINARYLKGDVVMTVRSSGQSGRFPLQVVAQQAFTGDLGYLAAKVDVSQVQDGDMEVQFEVHQLPSEEPRVSFTQDFFLTRPPLPVRRENLFAADQQPVIQQSVCPVTETRLGEHDDPIKLVIGDRPVYVCCEGCVQQVQNDPRGYVQKVSHLVQVNSAARRPNPPTPQRPHITVAQLSANDLALVQQQGTCPVLDGPLGGHGDPVKLMVDGRPLYVCCQGCVGQVEQNPYFYLDKVARNSREALARPTAYAANESQPPAPNAWFYERRPPSKAATGGSCCSTGSGASCH